MMENYFPRKHSR